VVADGQRSYIAWRTAREQAVSDASRPSLLVRTVTQWSGASGSDEMAPAVEVITMPGGDRRPRGPRYGTLVHAALATVPLDAADDVIARVVATEGRIVGATPAEIDSAREVVSAVLRHPLLASARAAAGAGRLYRESPVTIVRERELVEGVVDIAFDTTDGFVVLDFKTDRAEGGALASYATQVALYAEAIARATGRPARPVLMNV
jgi:ATP-dependent helicase/nuclease subunit A